MIPPMVKVTIRWVYILAILLGVAPLAARVLLGSLRAPDGSLEATILTSSSTGTGLIGLVVGGVLACVCGGLGSRLFGRDVGFTVAGSVFIWAAWRCGLPEHMVRLRESGAALSALVIEQGLVGAIAIASSIVVVVMGKDVPTHFAGSRVRAVVVGESEESSKVALAGGACTLASAAVSGAVAYFIAIESLKGQTVMATVCAGVAAAAASHVLGLALGVRTGVLPPMLGAVLAAIAGPIIARATHGAGLVTAATAGNLFELARPAPLDWAAGLLLGVPVGWGWSHSMTEQQVPGGQPIPAR